MTSQIWWTHLLSPDMGLYTRLNTPSIYFNTSSYYNLSNCMWNHSFVRSLIPINLMFHRHHSSAIKSVHYRCTQGQRNDTLVFTLPSLSVNNVFQFNSIQFNSKAPPYLCSVSDTTMCITTQASIYHTETYPKPNHVAHNIIQGQGKR